jgi:glycosyltransferase involved in cell wall biosynthesis
MRVLDVSVDLTLVAMEVDGKVLESSCSQKSLQYLACGLPVVAWDLEGNQYLRDERLGELVTTRSAEFLAAAFEKLLTLSREKKEAMRMRVRSFVEPERVLKLGKNGRRAALGEYAWRNDAGRLIGMYKMLEPFIEGSIHMRKRVWAGSARNRYRGVGGK